jgi:NAD(P)-dependent dehydrogenase (short-subunit alcohol dehydrogenase family)
MGGGHACWQILNLADETSIGASEHSLHRIIFARLSAEKPAFTRRGRRGSSQSFNTREPIVRARLDSRSIGRNARMRDVEGKVAFITGGASGIGLGMAEAFAAAGMKIVIADIDDAALEKAERTLKAGGASIKSVRLDVTSLQDWQKAAAEVEASFGPVAVLCNNAGMAQSRITFDKHLELVDVPTELWKLMFEINVTGVYYGMKTFASRMIERRGGGHVVNTSSMAGFLAPPGLAVYVASKFAVLGLSESAAAELAPHGIGMSILCPGGVQSNLVATTAARRASMTGANEGAASDLLTNALPHAPKMSARKVGDRVLKAIRENELYVITHPEYEPLMAERFDAIRAAIGESADPGYSDTPAMLDRSRSKIYAGQAARLNSVTSVRQ